MANRKNSSSRKDYTLYVAISSAIVLIAVIFVLIAKGAVDNGAETQTGAQSSLEDRTTTAAASLSGAEAATTEAPATEAPTTEASTTEAPTTEASTTEAPATEAPTTEAPTTEALTTELPVTEAPTTEAPETTEPQTTEVTEPDETTGGGVPYSGPAELSVLSGSVFIGDSRTDGLKLYSSILQSGARVYSNKGLAVNTIRTSAFVQTDAGTVTVIDALAADPNFDSVYIGLGINELAWGSIDSYIQKFGDLVDTVRQINPSATIYIESILPVTASRSASDEIFNNPRIAEFNVRLLALAQSMGVKFLDFSEMFTEYGGCIPEGSSGDGIHLDKPFCEKWLEYILEHRA